MNTDIRQRFAAIAALPDDAIKLDEAALLIAAEADEAISVHHYLGELDRLADSFGSDTRYHDGIASLASFIHEDAGFSGNVTDYYDPANSYLNRVIDIRQGIPITLAMIHIAIATRLDIPVIGISFPGHFLLQYGGLSNVIVDPFSGRELSRADCQNMLKQIAGARATLRDEYFEPASNRAILIRILDNLKQIFWRRKSWKESKACIDRQLLLLPQRVEFSIQLGAVYEMQGNTLLAQHTYTSVLTETSDERLRQLAGQRLLGMASKAKTLH